MMTLTPYLVFALALLIPAAVVHCWLKRHPQVRHPLPWYVWAVLLAVAAGGILHADGQAKQAQQRIENSLLGLAPTYASDLIEHGVLAINLHTPPDDPVYLNLIERQRRNLKLNPAIADIYVMTRDEQGRVRMLIDSETDYNRNGIYEDGREARTPIGEPYDNASPGIYKGFLEAWSGFEDCPQTDRWGTWVSAVYPITDDGKVAAILGIDYPAASWLAAAATSRNTTLAIAASIGLILIASSTTIAILNGTLNRQKELLVILQAREQAARVGSDAKSAFLAHMSHEIRTPITAIVGYADILRTSAVSDAERAEHLQTITRNGNHLLSVISDILDLASIEAGRLATRAEPIEPASIIAEIASLMDGQARKKGLELVLDIQLPLPATIDADPTRLKQILVNLTANAIKFTQQGSVTIRVAANLIDQLTIEVIDTGEGIKPEQAGKLFTPFVQGDAGMDRRFGGTGLGLAISRKLARSMGGDITLTSQLGQGSTFRLTLPVPPGTPKNATLTSLTCPLPTPPARPDKATATGKLVLLAEDGIDNQRLIAHHLRSDGWTVIIAPDGKQALRLATDARQNNNPFHLLLMDMQMPVMDGYAATRALRRAGFRTPIIALTAHANPGDREKCLQAGCDDYAIKPLDYDKLLNLARTWGISNPTAQQAA